LLNARTRPDSQYSAVFGVSEFVMAPRAYWKGYLKLSLVSCPIALFPATSEREKISFHQLNKKTGHRIKYRKVDAESGDEVDSADIIKGYEVGKGDYIEVEPEELEAVAIESKRTIDIDEFVPKNEIDELYLNSPYYIAPDGEVGQQAFAVIREAIRKEGMVAIGKVVFTSHEPSLRWRRAERDCSVSPCDILTRFATRPIISMISRMKKSQRTCSILPRTSLKQRKGTSTQASFKISMRMRSKKCWKRSRKESRLNGQSHPSQLTL
jgi:hypothetical protein